MNKEGGGGFYAQQCALRKSTYYVKDAYLVSMVRSFSISGFLLGVIFDNSTASGNLSGAAVANTI